MSERDDASQLDTYEPSRIEGMELVCLRDYFAARALMGQLAGMDWETTGRPVPSKEAADLALSSYQLAEAMLKARQQ